MQPVETKKKTKTKKKTTKDLRSVGHFEYLHTYPNYLHYLDNKFEFGECHCAWHYIT